MPRILVVEDDPQTATAVAEELARGGHEIVWVQDGETAASRALGERFALITLDRLLPGMDGLAVLSMLRNAGSSTPVLVLSALDDVDERVRGLRAGGDDYLTKPFALAELSARVDALLRRRLAEPGVTQLTIGDLEIDLMARTVRRGARLVDLTAREYRLLEFMARHAGQLLTRAMLFRAVWDYKFDPGTNLIDVHIGRLRRKVEQPGEAPLIHTVRRSGWVFNAPD